MEGVVPGLNRFFFQRKIMIALDTETTGLDPWHGCRAFIIATVNDQGKTQLWRTRVNPYTREVEGWENSEKLEIHNLLEKENIILCHNAKFDIRMLEIGGVPLPRNLWDKVHDTHLASHCLVSAGPHGLKDLAKKYLDIPDDDEKLTRVNTLAARRIGEKLGWRIGKETDPHWPTTKSGQSWWKTDLWMPEELIDRAEEVCNDEGDTIGSLFELNADWATACRAYAIRDVERTLGLWLCFEPALRQLGLWDVYCIRQKNLQYAYNMESHGITLRRSFTSPVQQKHATLAAEHERQCLQVVKQKIDNLESPKQLGVAMYNILSLPVLERSVKTNQPSTNKTVLAELRKLTRPTSPAGWFLRHLSGYRKRAHAAETIAGYERGCSSYNDPRQKCFARLHPNYNICGTSTTRGSSNNPNGQNIAKGEGLPKEEKFNLRDLFGPALGRVWYDHDYSNIELRIFALLSGEKEFLDAFAAGKSVHLIIAKELYPHLYCEDFKDRYPQQYQWVKNGNFALTYGAGQKTADATYHLPDAYRLIRRRFKQVSSFMDACINEAKQYGYVTTLGGYRLQVPMDRLYTTAVDYKVQGSAGYAMNLATNNCGEYVAALPDHHCTMLVHDEMLHDVPESHNPYFPFEIKRLMEKSGEILGLPLPVEMCRIRISWDQYEDIAPLPPKKRKGPGPKLILQ